MTVDQGQGQSSTGKSWSVDSSAKFSGQTTEVLVTNAAGGTAIPAAAMVGRRTVEIQNNGPNTIYITVDGTAPVVATNGRWIPAGQSWKIDVSARIVIRGIAATAAQVAGAATMVTELG